MPEGAGEHLEHAEHAQHAAHNPFDRRVTVSIAVVAAILAAVTMLGHKAHNETLRLQGEAIKEQSLVGITRTETANKYAFYQAKKNRGVMYEAFLDFVGFLPAKEGADPAKGNPTDKWKKEIAKYQTESPQMLLDAKALEEKTREYQENAAKAVSDSHRTHAQADRYDLGELGLQLGVVLCSMAILTRSRNFWYSGMLCSLLGVLVALSGYFEWFLQAEGHH